MWKTSVISAVVGATATAVLFYFNKPEGKVVPSEEDGFPWFRVKDSYGRTTYYRIDEIVSAANDYGGIPHYDIHGV